jgi:tetratricopeptide (TPR) repeat protein
VADDPAIPAEAVPDKELPALGTLWQVPTMIASLALIVLGLVYARGRAPTNDFDAALDQVEALIANDDLELARLRLTTVIEPNLLDATELQRARFEATLGDWLYRAREDSVEDDVDLKITDQYTRASRGGLVMDAPRLERWATSLIALNQMDDARDRIRDLEDLAAIGGEDEARRLNRVLRKLVEHGLHAPTGATYDTLMALLAEYRARRDLTADDEAWAISRQAELRLEHGHAREAVNRLLVDMRRLEANAETPGPAAFGELYVLLGRAYYQIGEDDTARQHLEHANGLFEGSELARGEGLALLGNIALGRGDDVEAFDRFAVVIRDFVGTPAYASGLLGRAEVRALAGDDVEAVDDYRALCELILRDGGTSDVDAERVTRSLIDRHDATVAVGRLGMAIDYIRVAERLYGKADVPTDVLFRIATTSRQLGDQVYRDAIGERDPRTVPAHEVDLGVRREATVHYMKAGEYYVDHARRIAGGLTEDESWADSLWMAADSYDRAGAHDLAITHFKEYIAGRSGVDAKWAEARFRLAQAYHAELDYASAIDYYQQVINEHALSLFAALSFVPLARCMIADGQYGEAEAIFQSVLAGNREIEPDAIEYRDALFAYGRMLNEQGDHVSAIEQLDKAVKWYPDAPGILAVKSHLADSYMGLASILDDRLGEPGLTPAQRDQIKANRSEHLKQAMDIFAEVRDGYEARDPRRLDELDRAYLKNAYARRGDCAFKLGLYREAISIFDQVARRYADDIVALTSLIQIVNAYHELGDAERARTAARRVQIKLAQLPAAAFDESQSAFPREAWERWLANSPLGGAPGGDT